MAFPPLASPIGARLHARPPFVTELTNIYKAYTDATTRVPGLQRALTQYGNLKATTTAPDNFNFEYLNGVAEELRVQESLEKRWQDLVRTVAPEAGDQESVFTLLKLVIEHAEYEANYVLQYTPVNGPKPPRREPTALPPQFEQSLATIARK